MSKEKENESVVAEVDAKKAEQKAKNEERKKLRNEAKDRIREAMKEAKGANADEVTVLMKDLLLTIGGGRKAGAPRGGGTGRVSLNDQLLDMFKDEDGNINAGAEVNEMDIFKAHRIGYPRMRWMIIHQIKDVDPAERVWIDYNEEEGVYRVEGLGEEMPEGWAGYVPSDKALL